MLLTWTAQAMMGTDMAGAPSPDLLPLLGAPVLDLLDDKLPISQAVRSAVLHLLRLLIASLRDAHADEVRIHACLLHSSIGQTLPALKRCVTSQQDRGWPR